MEKINTINGTESNIPIISVSSDQQWHSILNGTSGIQSFKAPMEKINTLNRTESNIPIISVSSGQYCHDGLNATSDSVGAINSRRKNATGSRNCFWPLPNNSSQQVIFHN
eukprot:14933966-Ditylum_brightwellii.AAC.1